MARNRPSCIKVGIDLRNVYLQKTDSNISKFDLFEDPFSPKAHLDRCRRQATNCSHMNAPQVTPTTSNRSRWSAILFPLVTLLTLLGLTGLSIMGCDVPEWSGEPPQARLDVSNEPEKPGQNNSRSGSSQKSRQKGTSNQQRGKSGTSNPSRSATSTPLRSGTTIPGRSGMTLPGRSGITAPQRSGTTVPSRSGVTQPARSGTSSPRRSSRQ